MFCLFCLFLACLLILFLMSANVHPNLGHIFPCSVCTRNVTWRGRSVQCCTCSKGIHFRCSLISFSRFKALDSSHSWICFPCRVPASSGDFTFTYTVTFSSDFSSFMPPLCDLTHLAPSVNATPSPSNLLSPFPHFVYSPSVPSPPSCSWLFSYTSCFLPLTS